MEFEGAHTKSTNIGIKEEPELVVDLLMLQYQEIRDIISSKFIDTLVMIMEILKKESIKVHCYWVLWIYRFLFIVV